MLATYITMETNAVGALYSNKPWTKEFERQRRRMCLLISETGGHLYRAVGPIRSLVCHPYPITGESALVL